MGCRMLSRAVAMSACLMVLAACQQAAITGRRQFIVIPRSHEISLGTQAYADVLKESTLSRDAAAAAIVERVGQRIARATHEPDFEWEFKLVESEQANAFCLPGGKVVIYTGILPSCKNEAGLAAVMGHEAAHAVLRHGAERMSQGLAVSIAEMGINQVLKSNDPQVRRNVLAIFGAGASVGVLLPYSREHEREADRVGMRFMARAGYDPAEAVALWKRMAETGGKGPIEFLSTHPSSEKRVELLQQILPEMRKRYERAPQKFGTGETLPVKGPRKRP